MTGPPQHPHSNPSLSPSSLPPSAPPTASPSTATPTSPPSSPSAISIHLSRSALLLGRGRPATALSSAEAALALAPNDPTALLARAQALLAASGPEAALPALRAAATAHGSTPAAHAAYGAALASAEPLRVAEAVAMLRSGVRGGADGAGMGLAALLTDVGVRLARAGLVEKAFEHYEEAVTAAPEYAQAWYNLAVCAADTGDRERAMECYERCVAVNPAHAQAWTNIGVLRRSAGRVSEAVAAYERALAVDMNYELAKRNLAIALCEMATSGKANGVPMKETVGIYKRAIELQPTFADAHYCLGVAYCEVGKNRRALAAYQLATHFNPRLIEAHHNTGVVHKLLGNFDASVAAYKAALTVDPNHHQTHSNIAVVYTLLGDVEKATTHLRAAMALAPNHAESHNNAGVLERDLGDIDAAILHYERCVALDPTSSMAAQNRLHALNYTDHWTPALTFAEHVKWGDQFQIRVNTQMRIVAASLQNPAFSAAAAAAAITPHKTDLPSGTPSTSINPTEVAASPSSGVPNGVAATAFVDGISRGDVADDVADGGQAPSIRSGADPRAFTSQQAAHHTTGNVAVSSGGVSDSVAAGRTTMAIAASTPQTNMLCLEADGPAVGPTSTAGNPNPPSTVSSAATATACSETTAASGDVRAYLSNYARRREPDSFPRGGAYPLTMGDGGASCATTCAPAMDIGSTNEMIGYPGGSSPAPRPLRVGFVSPDFFTHSVSYFVEVLLANHSPANVMVFAYANVSRCDAKTAKLRAYPNVAERWRDIWGMSAVAVANLVMTDEIDILIDCTGHTASNRLDVFALSPAPVLVTWIGYPNTTGLKAVHYRVTDGRADPVNTTQRFTEELWRLPDCFLCYTPSDDAPPVAAAPPCLSSGGIITFGSFNVLAKTQSRTIKLWADILKRVPDSRLLLKSKALVAPSGRKRMQALFEAVGISADRLDFVPLLPLTSMHLRQYAQIDVALDPFPYAGTTTTCEALYMGVPVVTLGVPAHAGDHANNVGVSLLNTIGLPDLVAFTEEDYADIAVRLATNPTRLASMRQTLRKQMMESPLGDAPRFIKNVEEMMLGMWKARGGVVTPGIRYAVNTPSPMHPAPSNYARGSDSLDVVTNGNGNGMSVHGLVPSGSANSGGSSGRAVTKKCRFTPSAALGPNDGQGPRSDPPAASHSRIYPNLASPSECPLENVHQMQQQRPMQNEQQDEHQHQHHNEMDQSGAFRPLQSQTAALHPTQHQTSVLQQQGSAPVRSQQLETHPQPQNPHQQRLSGACFPPSGAGREKGGTFGSSALSFSQRSQ